MRTKRWIKIQRVGNDDKKGQRVHERNSAIITMLQGWSLCYFLDKPQATVLKKILRCGGKMTEAYHCCP